MRWGWSNHGQSYLLNLTSVISTSCCQNADIDFYTPPIPLHQTCSPFIYPGNSGKHPTWMHGVSCSPMPRGVSPVWHWASNGQFALCGTLSVSLFLVSSSRVVVVHLAHLACTIIQRGVSLCRSNEERLISVENSWASCPLAFHEVGRDTFCNLAFHFVSFLLPPILNSCSSPCRHWL